MIHILHIEKSAFFRKSLNHTIEPLGYRVSESASLEEAFEILESEDIDLIIMALADNEHMVQELSASDYDNIPILILTSTDDMETREKLFRLGISDYILKNQITEKRLRNYLESFQKYKGIDVAGSRLKLAVLDDSSTSLSVINKVFAGSDFKNIVYYSRSKDLLASEEVYDIYIVDLVLKEMTGEEVMLEIRSKNPHAIIIIISSVDHNRTISNLLIHGADDFIVKPFDRNIFIARIKAHIRTYFLREELEEKNRQLSEMINIDGLTGLYNHKYTMEVLDIEFSRCLRYEHDLSVAMFDIDYFKRVNDTYGHPIGDEILIEVAGILNRNTRKTDIVGRYGGEEFFIIFTECDYQQAHVAAEKIRKAVEDHDFPYIGSLTLSGGVSTYDGHGINEMISRADKKLYEAKNQGRNRVL